MKIYLAGPIHDCGDECFVWRNALIEKVPQHEYLNPMDRDFRGREINHVKEIVEGDKADIMKCDMLLANATTISPGTMMEILLAWQMDKIVGVITKSNSPWIRYHSHKRWQYFSHCVEYMNRENGK